MKTRNYFKATLLSAVCALLVSTANAQIDPAPRKLLHLGVNQSLYTDGPMGAYAFYYWNMPDFMRTNQVLRLVIAPGYVDSELGFKSLITEHTDFAIGAFGGLNGDNYQEVRDGQYYTDESFNGNGGGVNVSLYHLFNPAGRIPLQGVLRGGMEYRSYCESSDTDSDFELPESQPFFNLRAGFRWGGKEPTLGPVLALEVSAWYEMQYRPNSDSYGFADDYDLESTTHQLFMRAQINYTTLKSKHYIVAGLMAGTLLNPDRLSAYRVGGVLPYTSEFPLYMPGYFQNELSVQDFGLLYGMYTIPLDDDKQWQLLGMAATGVMKYIKDMGQTGAWNSGVGAGGSFTSENRRWRVLIFVGYGINAQRKGGEGGYSIGLAFQYN
ncbi:MAG TPA: hypothetical protein PKA41_18675, partial [Verrucomicrobiota bacterium]|nr:hypothetical protein [Verrucomicrobiota bacterium]